MTEPAKMTLTNMRSGRTLEVQFNPETIRASLEAAYNDLKVLGQSYEPQQYQNTSNRKVPITLLYDRLTSAGGGGGGGSKYMPALNFLRSLVYPYAADSVQGGGTPPILFVWPNLYTFECRVREYEEEHKRFAFDGRSTLAEISFELHSFSMVRRTTEEVEFEGWQDSSSGTGYEWEG